MHKIEFVALDAIKPNPRNARTHSKKQIRQIADSIGDFGFPCRCSLTKPRRRLPGTVVFWPRSSAVSRKYPSSGSSGLSEAQKRALLLADNKIAENAGWDRERLAIELPELS